jgi:uncharacterized UPF0160 family protein
MKIVTHSGRFHTDEVYASALLDYLYSIADEDITRTRDQKVINEAAEDENTIIIDVGRKYDPSKLFYDHHQAEFNDTFSDDYDIPLSSCGLIWKHYGQKIVEAFLVEYYPKDVELVDVDTVYEEFYRKMILSIDANDNGIKQLKNPQGVQYNFHYNPTLTEMVSLFNSGSCKDEKAQMEGFLRAKALCSQMFHNKMDSIVRKHIEYNTNVDEFRRIFNDSQELEYMYISDDDINYTIYLRDFDPKKQFKFFISMRGASDFRIYTRRKHSTGFETVAPIISEEKARKLVGDDLVFVHKACFTGGCKSLESARKVVEASLREFHKSKKSGFDYKILLTFAGICGAVAFSYPVLRGLIG